MTVGCGLSVAESDWRVVVKKKSIFFATKTILGHDKLIKSHASR